MDICLKCGTEIEKSEIWGAECPECRNHENVIHIATCDFCSNPIGIMLEDDYIAIERLVCSNCILKCKKEKGLKWGDH